MIEIVENTLAHDGTFNPFDLKYLEK